MVVFLLNVPSNRGYFGEDQIWKCPSTRGVSDDDGHF